MTISQRQIVQECFDGERERNCSYCPAHISKNGICCFGHKFEYGDPQCHSCVHVATCEPATQQYLDGHTPAYQTPPTYANQQPQRRIMVNQSPPIAQRPQYANQPAVPQRRSLPVYNQPQKDSLLMTKSIQIQPLPAYEEMSFWRQMGIITTWGAVEGALELLLGFFRQRRPG